MIPPPRHRALAALVAAVALGLSLRTAGLGAQPLTADDVTVRTTAHNFAETGWPEPTMWNHPRLRDLLVSASLETLGEGPWGLKAWSVLLGTLSVATAAALVLALTGSVAGAAITALLLTLDPLHVDFSRQAINDVHLAFFPVAAVLALLRYRARPRAPWLVAAGALLGLGLATKWSAAFPVAAAAAWVLTGRLRSLASARERAAETAFFAASLALLPAALYLLTYTPWFGRGHDLLEWVRFQRAMAHETVTHTGYAGTKLPGYPGEIIRAWRWFVSPVWYVDYVPPDAGAPGRFLSGVGNPLAWLAVWPSAAFAAWRWRARTDVAAGVLLALFLAAYVPFASASRPIWTNSALGVLPFAMALVGWAAGRTLSRAPLAVGAWIAAAVVVAALLWLPATGRSTPPTDALVRLLVSPEALDPGNHP